MLYAEFGATAVSDDLRAAMLAGEDVDGISTIRRMYFETDSTYVGSAYCYPGQYLALQLENKDEVLRKHLEPIRNVSAIQRFVNSGAAPDLCANDLLRSLSSYGVKSGQVVSITLCSADNSFEMHANCNGGVPVQKNLQAAVAQHAAIVPVDAVADHHALVALSRWSNRGRF